MNSYSEKSVKSYFDYYGKLWHQQNMLQDHVRTSTYNSAIVQNKSDFDEKVSIFQGFTTGFTLG